MSINFLTYQLSEKFQGKTYITRNELYEFYKSFEPGLSQATFSWRIFNLKEKKVLQSVKRNVYTLIGKKTFQPVIAPKLKSLGTMITKEFPEVRNCVWNTQWLNEWALHQSGKFLTIVEVEASAKESIFYFLKDADYKNVFLDPDGNMIERYLYDQTETIIVKTLVTKAPIQQKRRFSYPVIEKILVDLFIDNNLYAPFQGAELIHIYNTLYRNYNINFTKLGAYARRRGREAGLLEFISKNTQLKEL